jgi:dGTP triphosphohydrolase
MRATRAQPRAALSGTASKGRSPFRRDCDRIIHSTAFRRLKHKTQVFVFDEGDHYRTRLTHTLEVAQVARALARRWPRRGSRRGAGARPRPRPSAVRPCRRARAG